MNSILVGIAVGGWILVLLLYVLNYKMNEDWYMRCCEQNEDWSRLCDSIIAEMVKNDADENEVTE